MQVDDQFRQLMSSTDADPMVLRFAEIPHVMVCHKITCMACDDMPFPNMHCQ